MASFSMPGCHQTASVPRWRPPRRSGAMRWSCTCPVARATAPGSGSRPGWTRPAAPVRRGWRSDLRMRSRTPSGPSPPRGRRPSCSSRTAKIPMSNRPCAWPRTPAPSSVASQVPLTTLLSWAWIAFTIEADNAVEAASSGDAGRVIRISMPMWANGLRFIDGDGITVGELQARARARCNIGGLERWGWITVGDAGAGRRDGYGTHRGVRSDTVLRTTRAGASARRRWPLAVAGTEQRWRARFGAGLADSLQQALLPLAGPLPSAPPEVSPADGFRTHVLPGPETEQDASLGALLGQALTALTIEDEQGSKASRPAAANILRVIDDQVVRLRDLPSRSGISKEAAAMAVSYLVRKRLAEPRPERSVV